MRPTRVELAELADLVATVARHVSTLTLGSPANVAAAETAVRATEAAERLAAELAEAEAPALCLGCQERPARDGSPLCQSCADDVARDLAAGDEADPGEPGSLCSAGCGYCGRCGGA